MPAIRQPDHPLAPRDRRLSLVSHTHLPLLTILASWAIAFCWYSLVYRPPAIRPPSRDEPAFQVFAAERRLKNLLGTPESRPTGSDAHRRIQEAIAQALRDFGLDVQLHSFTATARNPKWPETLGTEVAGTNIVARRAGRNHQQALGLVCHYDSVPAGPGICDDALAVGTCLQILDQLAQQTLQHDLIVLFSDAEELGLLGAEAFLRDHPWAADLRAVINLEARGTSGPVLMFETGSDSRWLVSEFATVDSKKFASSLFYEIYRHLPNNTDFTQFKRAGIQGYNLAFIGDVKNYHTPDDDFAHANRASWRHQGDLTWQLLLRLDRSLAKPRIAGRAVDFDVFGRWIVYWPQPWTTAPALAIAVLFAVGCFSTGLKFATVIPTIAVVITTLLLVGGCVYAAIGVFSAAGILSPPWPEHPMAVGLAIWVTAITVLVGWTRLAFRGRRATDSNNDLSPNQSTPIPVQQSVWGLWIALSVFVAISLPGGSYLFLRRQSLRPAGCWYIAGCRSARPGRCGRQQSPRASCGCRWNDCFTTPSDSACRWRRQCDWHCCAWLFCPGSWR